MCVCVCGGGVGQAIEGNILSTSQQIMQPWACLLRRWQFDDERSTWAVLNVGCLGPGFNLRHKGAAPILMCSFLPSSKSGHFSSEACLRNDLGVMLASCLTVSPGVSLIRPTSRTTKTSHMSRIRFEHHRRRNRRIGLQLDAVVAHIVVRCGWFP